MSDDEHRRQRGVFEAIYDQYVVPVGIPWHRSVATSNNTARRGDAAK
jgi:hypothetical protein